MFNEIEGMVNRAVSGEIDKNSLGQAAQEHVQNTDHQTVQQNMQQAAQSAQQNNQPGLAQQITSMLERDRSDPQALKQDVVTLVKDHPEVLKHFESTFAQNIMSRI